MCIGIDTLGGKWHTKVNKIYLFVLPLPDTAKETENAAENKPNKVFMEFTF